MAITPVAQTNHWEGSRPAVCLDMNELDVWCQRHLQQTTAEDARGWLGAVWVRLLAELHVSPSRIPPGTWAVSDVTDARHTAADEITWMSDQMVSPHERWVLADMFIAWLAIALVHAYLTRADTPAVCGDDALRRLCRATVAVCAVFEGSDTMNIRVNTADVKRAVTRADVFRCLALVGSPLSVPYRQALLNVVSAAAVCRSLLYILHAPAGFLQCAAAHRNFDDVITWFCAGATGAALLWPDPSRHVVSQANALHRYVCTVHEV